MYFGASLVMSMPMEICFHNSTVYFLNASIKSEFPYSALCAFIHVFFVFAVHLKNGFRVKKFWGNIALDYLPHLQFVLHCLYYDTSQYLSD
jgi:uncharacterized membrane protein YqaE (UPF0057 family)